MPAFRGNTATFAACWPQSQFACLGDRFQLLKPKQPHVEGVTGTTGMYRKLVESADSLAGFQEAKIIPQFSEISFQNVMGTKIGVGMADVGTLVGHSLTVLGIVGFH
jgi:hypothetical protein